MGNNRNYLNLLFITGFLWTGASFANIQFPSLPEVQQAINRGSKELIRENKYRFVISLPDEWPKKVVIDKLMTTTPGKIETEIQIGLGYFDFKQYGFDERFNKLYPVPVDQWGPAWTGIYGDKWEATQDIASIKVPVKYWYRVNETETIIRRGALKITITFYRPRGTEKLISRIIQTGDGSKPEDFSVEPYLAPHRIFAKTDFKQIAADMYKLLIDNNAMNRPAGAVWLLRESSSTPGALVVSYYDRSPSEGPVGVRNKTFILKREQKTWEFVPGNIRPDPNNLIPVYKNSEQMEEMTQHLKSLYEVLNSSNFKKEGQIIPRS